MKISSEFIAQKNVFFVQRKLPLYQNKHLRQGPTSEKKVPYKNIFIFLKLIKFHTNLNLVYEFIKSFLCSKL